MILLMVHSQSPGAADTALAMAEAAFGAAKYLGWLYAWLVIALAGSLFLVICAPLGDQTLGGPAAAPRIGPVGLCAAAFAVALAPAAFYAAAAEPAAQISAPPPFLANERDLQARGLFGLSAAYRHWALGPFVSVGALGLVVALNLHRGGWTSFGAALFNRPSRGAAVGFIDMLATASIAITAAAALSNLLALISAGGRMLLSRPPGQSDLTAMTIIFAALCLVVSRRGLIRGASGLALWALRILAVVAAAAFILGPTRGLWEQGLTAFVQFIKDFLSQGLRPWPGETDRWFAKWASLPRMHWLALAPGAALVLGWLGRGYNVRIFILLTVAAPVALSIAWIAVIGGSALTLDLATRGAVAEAVQVRGASQALYTTLGALPVSPAFVLAILAAAILITGAGVLAAIFALVSTTLGKPAETDAGAMGSGQIVWAALWSGLIVLLGASLARSLYRDYFASLTALFGVIGLVWAFLALVMLIRHIRSAPKPPAAAAAPSASPSAAPAASSPEPDINALLADLEK